MCQLNMLMLAVHLYQCHCRDRTLNDVQVRTITPIVAQIPQLPYNSCNRGLTTWYMWPQLNGDGP